MKRIKLTQDKYALVDDEDYEYLSQWKWYAVKHDKTIYGVTKFSIKNNINKKQKNIYMHRVIAERMGIKNPDHKDRNGLNNKRNNLREATKSQQNQNKSLQENNTLGYKGIYWHTRDKKWAARICINKKMKYLGYFNNKKDAAKAYNEAAKKYFGEFAVLNNV